MKATPTILLGAQAEELVEEPAVPTRPAFLPAMQAVMLTSISACYLPAPALNLRPVINNVMHVVTPAAFRPVPRVVGIMETEMEMETGTEMATITVGIREIPALEPLHITSLILHR